MKYPIFHLTEVESSQLEQLGTKAKFWFVDQQTGKLVLFKAGRPGTGENWAEKVCSEICSLIGLPHAKYDLANCDGKEGVISPSFTPTGSRLVHGNELLAKSSQGEEGQMNYSARQHTVRRVMLQLGIDSFKLPLDHNLPTDINSVSDVFVGYLLLDALVGNQDRHFENWGSYWFLGKARSLHRLMITHQALGETKQISAEK